MKSTNTRRFVALVLFSSAYRILVFVQGSMPAGGGGGAGYHHQHYGYHPQQAGTWQQGPAEDNFVYDQQQLQQERDRGLSQEEQQPPPLPPSWTEYWDPASGQPYYYNSADGTTTWDRPVMVIPSTPEREPEERDQEPQLHDSSSASGPGDYQNDYNLTEETSYQLQEAEQEVSSSALDSEADGFNTPPAAEFDEFREDLPVVEEDREEPVRDESGEAQERQEAIQRYEENVLTDLRRSDESIRNEELWRKSQGWSTAERRDFQQPPPTQQQQQQQQQSQQQHPQQLPLRQQQQEYQPVFQQRQQPPMQAHPEPWGLPSQGQLPAAKDPIRSIGAWGIPREDEKGETALPPQGLAPRQVDTPLTHWSEPNQHHHHQQQQQRLPHQQEPPLEQRQMLAPTDRSVGEKDRLNRSEPLPQSEPGHRIPGPKPIQQGPGGRPMGEHQSINQYPRPLQHQQQQQQQQQQERPVNAGVQQQRVIRPPFEQRPVQQQSHQQQLDDQRPQEVKGQPQRIPQAPFVRSTPNSQGFSTANLPGQSVPPNRNIPPGSQQLKQPPYGQQQRPPWGTGGQPMDPRRAHPQYTAGPHGRDAERPLQRYMDPYVPGPNAQGQSSPYSPTDRTAPYASYQNLQQNRLPSQQRPQASSTGQLVATQAAGATSAVRDALQSTWRNLLGFSNKTMEAVETARSAVVSGAKEAGQSISSTSANLWGQAKDTFGSVFESTPNHPSEYSIAQRYPTQPPPGAHGPPVFNQPPGYPQMYRPPPQHQQPQQSDPQQTRYQYPRQQGPQPIRQLPPGYEPMQPRVDPAYPHQASSNQRPLQPPHQSQWGPQGAQYPPNYGLERYRQYPPPRDQSQIPPNGQQQQQAQPPQGRASEQVDAWQHPGLGADGF